MNQPPPIPDPHESRIMPDPWPFIRRHFWWMVLLAFFTGVRNEQVLQWINKYVVPFRHD